MKRNIYLDFKKMSLTKTLSKKMHFFFFNSCLNCFLTWPNPEFEKINCHMECSMKVCQESEDNAIKMQLLGHIEEQHKSALLRTTTSESSAKDHLKHSALYAH